MDAIGWAFVIVAGLVALFAILWVAGIAVGSLYLLTRHIIPRILIMLGPGLGVFAVGMWAAISVGGPLGGVLVLVSIIAGWAVMEKLSEPARRFMEKTKIINS